jgi:hypothetical protein
MVGVPIIPVSAITGYNTDKLLAAMVMLLAYEWSPILHALDVKGGVSFANLAKRLGTNEQKVRSYLRWFELRRIVAVDWDKRTASLAAGVSKLLSQR